MHRPVAQLQRAGRFTLKPECKGTKRGRKSNGLSGMFFRPSDMYLYSHSAYSRLCLQRSKMLSVRMRR